MTINENIRTYRQILAGNLPSGDIYKLPSVAANYDDHISTFLFESVEDYEREMNGLVNLVQLRGRDVVDLGCGTGLSLQVIRQANPNSITAVDSSSPIIAKAMKKPAYGDVTFILEQAEDLSQAVENVDVVVSFNLFQYLRDPLRVVSEVYRSLKSGGDFVFNVLAGDKEDELHHKMMGALNDILGNNSHQRIPDIANHVKHYGLAEVESWARKTGFSLMAYEEYERLAGPELARRIGAARIAEMVAFLARSGHPHRVRMEKLRVAQLSFEELYQDHALLSNHAHVHLQKS